MDLLINKKVSYYKNQFIGLIYSKQKIKDKEFENCSFENCRFDECIFDNCKFLDCIFVSCVISANKPFNSQFVNITFKDSKIMGFDWTKAKNIRSLTFEKCDIGYSNFSFVKLPNLKLIECVVHDVSFSNADLSGGIFTNCDFLNSIFSNTNLTKADFRHAFNYIIDFNFNILKKARFSLPEAASLLKSLDIILEV